MTPALDTRPACDMRPVFDIRDVTKSFGATAVLHGVSLTVPVAGTTVLVGPSGCGKSTLLRLMMGLEGADGGTVTFEGDPVTAGDLALRRRMGYMVQGGGLFPHLTAAGNAALMARFLRWPRDRIAARLAELSALCRFPPDLLSRRPAALSGGQKQRVAIMRALMLDPHVILLDEPFGALDTLVRHDLQDELKALFADLGKTVVLVTHDMTEAAFSPIRWC